MAYAKFTVTVDVLTIVMFESTGVFIDPGILLV